MDLGTGAAGTIEVETIFTQKGVPIKKIVENVQELAGNVKKITSQTYKWNNKTKDWGKTAVSSLDKTVKGMKKFKMYLLSTMFLGLSLKKTMGDIMAPAVDAFGISDMLSAMYLDVMSPAMEKVAEQIYGLVDSVMSMSDSQKEAMGWTVLLGYGFGSLLENLSSLGLGIAGLKDLWKELKMTANISSIELPDISSITKLISTKLSEIPTSYKIGISLVLLAALYNTLKDLKGGDFNFGTALWDTISSAFSAYAGASMFKPTAPYAGQIALGVTAIVGIGFLLKSDFLSNLTVFLKGVWNEFANAWNSTNLSKLKKLSAYDLTGISSGSYGIGTFTPSTSGYNLQNLGGSSGVFGPPTGWTGGQSGSNISVTTNATVNITGNSSIDERKLADMISNQTRQEILKFGVVK